jgi:hypothetical protein
MQCKNCKSKNIKTRKNYSHGKQSKATYTKVCKDCYSTNIEVTEKNNQNQRFKKRRKFNQR